jgi:hypothetical protein
MLMIKERCESRVESCKQKKNEKMNKLATCEEERINEIGG